MLDALTNTSGWSGFADGLELIAEWCIEFWESLYPELDWDEDNDPTARLSVLSHLVSEIFWFPIFRNCHFVNTEPWDD